MLSSRALCQVIEARELSGDSVRKHSETEFRKSFFHAVAPSVRDSSARVRHAFPLQDNAY